MVQAFRECAQVFTTNLDAWLAALRGSDGVGLETRAAMASLLPKHERGDVRAFAAAARGADRRCATRRRREGAAPASSLAASVASRPAAAAANALANLDAAEAAVRAAAPPEAKSRSRAAASRARRLQGVRARAPRAVDGGRAIGQRASGSELAADAR